MNFREVLKQIFKLRTERTDVLRYYNFNNRIMMYLNNKKVLSGKESKELTDRRRTAEQQATELYFIEKDIDKLLAENPRIHLIGFNTPIVS